MAAKTLRDVLVRRSLGYLAFGALALGSYGLLYLARVMPTDNLATWWGLIPLLWFVSVAGGVLKYLAVLGDRDFDGSQWTTFVCPHCNCELPLSKVPADPKEAYPCPLCSKTISGRAAQ
jgi:hypothetical protein